MVALSIQLVSITPSRILCYLNQQEEMVAFFIQLVSITHSDLLYTKPTRGDGGPFYTAGISCFILNQQGIDYSIPICYILNQQEEMVALSIQLVSITPSRSVLY